MVVLVFVGGTCGLGIGSVVVVGFVGESGCCIRGIRGGCSCRVVQLVVSVLFDLGAQESVVLAIGNHTTLVIYIHLLPCFHFRSFAAAAAPGLRFRFRFRYRFHLRSAAD